MNSTSLSAVFTNAQQHYLSTARPFYYVPESRLVSLLPDNLLSLAAPIIAYWVSSLFFHALDCSNAQWLQKYRIHESAEVKSRNLASRGQVIQAVVVQHILQTMIGLWWMEHQPTGDEVNHLANMAGQASFLVPVLQRLFGNKEGAQWWLTHGHEAVYFVYWWAIPMAKLLFAMYVLSLYSSSVVKHVPMNRRFIIDTWEYFLHRAMHMNTFLYKTFHSVHHRLYVPYAFGALYNHPLEGFVLDSVGAAIAELVSSMHTREAIFLFVISTLKTVDDHCGYRLPWDPLQFLTSNNADYHDIHHQVCAFFVSDIK